MESLECRRLLATAVGEEFPVNGETTGNQYAADVATSSDGQFAVVWDSVGQDGDGHGIYGRWFDNAGLPRGSEIAINTTTTGDQLFPSLDMSATGQAVVVWEGEDNDGRGVFGRLFDHRGTPVGEEFQVNLDTSADQMLPQVSVNAGGDFLVTWNDVDTSIGTRQIVARQFSASGTPLTGEIVVSNPTQPAFFGTGSLMNDGQFVVVWEQQDGASSTSQIAGRFFDSNAVGGDEFLISPGSGSDHFYPTVGTNHEGQVVIAWDRQIGDAHTVVARRYAGAPEAASEVIQVSDTAMDHPLFPTVSMDSEGGFLAAWDQFARDGDGQGSFARTVQASTDELGDVFQLNTESTDDQQQPAVSLAADQTVVTVWNSYGQDGDAFGVFGQRFGIKPVGGSISGYVYADVNDNGVMDEQEIGLPNIPIVLSGSVDAVVLTNTDGYYRFEDVPPGICTVTQVQPHAFLDGTNVIGDPAMGNASPNQFSGIEMRRNLDVTLYNFGERGLRPEFISKRHYLALAPSAGQLAADFTATDDRAIFAFDIDGDGSLTVSLDGAESEPGISIDLYSSEMLPVAIGAPQSAVQVDVDQGDSLVLYVAGLELDREVQVSVRLQPEPQASVDPVDVNRDGRISPIDALLVINHLNDFGNGRSVDPGSPVDVNRDGTVTPIDAMLVINRLKANSAEGESASPSADLDRSSWEVSVGDLQQLVATGKVDPHDDVPLLSLPLRWALLPTTTQQRLVDAVMSETDDSLDLRDWLAGYWQFAE
jgi:hypothetical protein